MKKLLLYLLLGFSSPVFCQQKLDKLTVEKIMRDPKWIGASPSGSYWSYDGKYLFFNWNPEKSASDSLYYITNDNTIPRRAPASIWQNIPRASSVIYNHRRTYCTYGREGDIFLMELKTGKERRITQTSDLETSPLFSFDETKIVYIKNQNLYAWDIADGSTIQLTNFQKGTAPVTETKAANSR